MGTLDPATAPLLFGSSRRDWLEGDSFELILQFAQGYRDIIVADGCEDCHHDP